MNKIIEIVSFLDSQYAAIENTINESSRIKKIKSNDGVSYNKLKHYKRNCIVTKLIYPLHDFDI